MQYACMGGWVLRNQASGGFWEFGRFEFEAVEKMPLVHYSPAAEI